MYDQPTASNGPRAGTAAATIFLLMLLPPNVIIVSCTTSCTLSINVFLPPPSQCGCLTIFKLPGKPDLLQIFLDGEFVFSIYCQRIVINQGSLVIPFINVINRFHV